jgi:cupin fold WbuC family metalloprotein
VKKINDEVFIAEESVVRIGADEIAGLKAQARRNPRHRVRICAHKNAQDRLHEMLIVLTNEVYIRPHKHTNKSESFHVIEGEALVLFFTDIGDLAEVIHLGDAKSGRTFYFRNDDPRYHSQIVLSEALVFHETTNGPFNREDTQYAPWAPEEADAVQIPQYLESLRERIARFAARP